MIGTKLGILMEEDLELQYSVKILVVRQIKIGSSKLFVYNKMKKKEEVRGLRLASNNKKENTCSYK